MYPITERTLDPILTLLLYDIRETRIGPSVPSRDVPYYRADAKPNPYIITIRYSRDQNRA